MVSRKMALWLKQQAIQQAKQNYIDSVPDISTNNIVIPDTLQLELSFSNRGSNRRISRRANNIRSSKNRKSITTSPYDAIRAVTSYQHNEPSLRNYCFKPNFYPFFYLCQRNVTVTVTDIRELTDAYLLKFTTEDESFDYYYHGLVKEHGYVFTSLPKWFHMPSNPFPWKRKCKVSWANEKQWSSWEYLD
jgi:hypothetical protein